MNVKERLFGWVITYFFAECDFNLQVQFIEKYASVLNSFPAGIYLLKVKNRNPRTKCEITGWVNT